MGQLQSICFIDGCEKHAHRRGMCSMHSERLRLRGTTALVRVSEEERFWKLVYFPPCEDDCWTWMSSLVKGYGRFSARGKKRIANRYSYQITVGPIPEGLTIDHLCRNTICVNPAHLEAVTQKVNTNRGNAMLPHTNCYRGHELSGQNLIHNRNGTRQCRLCYNAAQRNRREQKRVERNSLAY